MRNPSLFHFVILQSIVSKVYQKGINGVLKVYYSYTQVIFICVTASVSLYPYTVFFFLVLGENQK